MDGWFSPGRRYLRSDLEQEECEFRCVAVGTAPDPGAIGQCAFGFQIDRGTGRLGVWLPMAKISTDGSLGLWADAGAV